MKKWTEEELTKMAHDRELLKEYFQDVATSAFLRSINSNDPGERTLNMRLSMTIFRELSALVDSCYEGPITP